MAVHGFDVSSYQPAGPDFAVAGREFAFCKATEGLTYNDPHFASNRAAMHAQGLVLCGFYHFARANDPVAEAEHFLRMVGSPQPGEVAVLDYETGGWNPSWIAAWCRRVKGADWRVGLYTYLGMLGSYDHAVVDFLWLAAYGSRKPNRGEVFWQHTDGQSSVSGNDGPWDCSRFEGTVDDLRAWVGNSNPNPATFHPSGGQEDSTMALVTGPSESRVDLVVVGQPVDAHGFGPVFHAFGANVAALLKGGSENLGGAAKSVSAGWTADGATFVVAAHGTDDHVWLKAFDAASGKWSDWQRQANLLLSPAG